MSAEDPSRGGLLGLLGRLLSEPTMGLLAIVAVGLTLAPLAFPLGPAAASVFEALNAVLVGLLVLEYAVQLALARDKGAFVRSGWRVLDLLTLSCSLAALLPSVSNTLLSATALRLVRAVALGTRAGGALARDKRAHGHAEEQGPLRVSVLREAHLKEPKVTSWSEFLEWAEAPKEDWFHAASLAPTRFAELAEALGIPPTLLEFSMTSAGYPRLERLERYSTVFLWLPTLDKGADEVRRNGILLLSSGGALLTLTQHPVDLQSLLTASMARYHLPNAAFPLRMLFALFKMVLQRHEELTGYFEGELRLLEEAPVPETRAGFLQHAFRLKKGLAVEQADLWRLKALLAASAQPQTALHGLEAEHLEYLRVLADEAEYLYETVGNAREQLLSIIDLHLNVTSFEMNKFMRVLAVASVLGLFPSVVGGLLGMNVAGNPWPVNLTQVTFCVSFGIVLCLYFFFVKGWMR